MTRVNVLMVTLVMLLASGNLSYSQSGWTTYNTIPNPAAGTAYTSDGNTYSAVGGLQNGYGLNSGGYSNFYFSGLWKNLPAMPEYLAYSASVIFGNRLYIIGGTDGFSISNKVLCYNYNSNQWSYKAPIPTGRRRASAVVVNGKIYVFGGSISNSACTDKIEMYDPATDNWTLLGTLPFALTDMMATPVGPGKSKVFICGGRISESLSIPLPFSTVYDVATGQISMATNMPEALYGSGIAYDPMMQMVYVTGGTEGNGAVSDTLMRWYYGTNTWMPGWKLSQPIAEPTLFWATDGFCKVELFLMGGITANNDTSAAVQVFTLYYIFPEQVELKGKVIDETPRLVWEHVEGSLVEWYLLQRSIGGNPFEDIAEFDAMSGGVFEYKDGANIDGEVAYRVVGRTVSGSENYSNVLSFYIKKENFYAALFPNPTAGRVWIDYRIKADQNDLKMDVFDPTGRVVASRVFPPAVAGVRPEVDLGFLSPGTYVVRMSAGREVSTQKLMIQ